MNASIASDPTQDIQDCFEKKPEQITPCQVSGNNRLYSFMIERDRYIIKYYFQNQYDKRDRLYNETYFLNYLATLNIHNVPKVIYKNPHNHYTILTFKAGKTPDKVTDDMVIQAADFIVSINNKTQKTLLNAMPMASESLQSIEQFHDHIGERVIMLQQQNFASQNIKDFKNLVNMLAKAFDQQSKYLQQAIQLDDARTFWDQREYIASPSDFGFHNVLKEMDGTCNFIDFEYAGRDDIAKLYCDFLLHPAHQLNKIQAGLFKQKLSPLIGDKAIQKRIELIFPLIALKWACICCNIFVPEWLERRKFSNPDYDFNTMCETQLKKAYALLERVHHPI